MQRSAIVFLLAAAFTAVPAQVSAQPETSASVSVVAHSGRHHIGPTGPDANGRYQLRINIADLNPATDAGWQLMQARVGRGTADLCSMAAQQPQIPGFRNSGERQCRSDTLAAAQAQMAAARDAARQGRAMASLALNTAS